MYVFSSSQTILEFLDVLLFQVMYSNIDYEILLISIRYNWRMLDLKNNSLKVNQVLSLTFEKNQSRIN